MKTKNEIRERNGMIMLVASILTIVAVFLFLYVYPGYMFGKAVDGIMEDVIEKIDEAN